MSVRQTVTITIGCDHTIPILCATTFVATAQKLGEARTEARDAGWYIGTGDKAYCNADATAMGLRVKKPSAE